MEAYSFSKEIYSLSKEAYSFNKEAYSFSMDITFTWHCYFKLASEM